MIGKRILIQGNTVVSGTIKQTAGGIWVSCVQDCRILGNHIEGYQDVGIDFEGSRNCIADSNILINNNKGLALFGNCKNITFSHNTVYMTRDNEPNNGFFNTYSNGYKNIVDTRNTDIYVIGNTFNNEAKTYNEQHGSGGILVGSAKRIYFKENVFINCFFKTHYCDDLESIEIANNSFVNNFRGAAYPVVDLAISQRNKTEKQPTINYIVTGNRFSSTDDSKASSIVNVSTVGGLPDTTPWCDLRFIIRDNIIDRETRGNTIQFTDNYQTTRHLDMQVDGVIKNNITNGLISLDIPKDGQRKKCNVLVEGNVERVGKHAGE
jgi:parallel beta-helix repeat protein